MGRFTPALRLAVLLVVYAVTIAAFASWFSQIGSASGVFTVLAFRYSLALYLTPNVLSFGIAAWLLRARWTSLRVPQILVAAFCAGALTLILVEVCALLLGPFAERSEPAMEIVVRITMLLPGILAAQLLRFGARSETKAPAPKGL